MAEIDHDAISYTALKVLEHRARDCTIPLAREMARAAGVQWRSPWAKRFLRKLVGGKVHSGLYLQLRYDALSRALAMYRGCAVLELAAGYGTRGLAESAQREAYIETDLGNLVARKERVVRSLRGDQHGVNHHFLRLNVTDPDDLQRAASFITGLNLVTPLAIIHEGLFMYFSDEEQARVRDGIAGLMRGYRPGAAWLTTDFSERDIDKSLVQKLMSLKLRRRVGRRLNYFADNAAVERFLRAGGLQAEWLPSGADGSARVRAYAEYFRVHRITLRAGR